MREFSQFGKNSSLMFGSPSSPRIEDVQVRRQTLAEDQAASATAPVFCLASRQYSCDGDSDTRI